MKASDLTKQIAERLEGLAKLTDKALVSDAMQRFFDCAAKFHRYSPVNQFLIYCFRPDATHVAGYNAWLKLHRYVRKGEKGIPILAPCRYPKREDTEDKDEDDKHIFFKTVYVFDVSQTEGEPLPPTPEWISPERNQALHDRLVAFALSQGITYTERDQLEGDAQGYSEGGKVVLRADAGTKTLVHEIAHELLHKREIAGLALPRHEKELEAEAVGYVVAQHFGLPSAGSPNYLALAASDGKAIMAHLQRIGATAKHIIEAVESQEDSHAEG